MAEISSLDGFGDGEEGDGEDELSDAGKGLYYLFSVHTYCSVCGHDWAAVLQLPPSQQRFLECPECRCWSRVNLIDDGLSQ